MDIGTTPVNLGSGNALFQNLGPDLLYVGRQLGNDLPTEDTGVRIAAGEAITLGAGSQAIYAVSAGTSDVRVLGAGTGIFAVEAPA